MLTSTDFDVHCETMYKDLKILQKEQLKLKYRPANNHFVYKDRLKDTIMSMANIKHEFITNSY